jgi:ferredoxin
LLISESNPNVNVEAIQHAIDCCPLDAISMGEA